MVALVDRRDLDTFLDDALGWIEASQEVVRIVGNGREIVTQPEVQSEFRADAEVILDENPISTARDMSIGVSVKQGRPSFGVAIDDAIKRGDK